MRYFGLIILIFLLGCQPAYHRDRSRISGDCEGYRESKIDSTSYLITICGGYSFENADMYVLYRAAELTAAAGKTYFAVIDNPPTHANQRAAKRIRFLQNPAGDTLTAFNAPALLASLGPTITKK